MKMSQFFLRCWWMILFLLFCYGCYLHGMEAKRKNLQELEKKSAFLKQQLQVAQQEQSGLLQEIESQSDPAWTEMLMIKRLGMVPSGQVKVYFEE